MASEEMVGLYECPSFPEKLAHVLAKTCPEKSRPIWTTQAPHVVLILLHSRRVFLTAQNIAW